VIQRSAVSNCEMVMKHSNCFNHQHLTLQKHKKLTYFKIHFKDKVLNSSDTTQFPVL